MGRLGRLRGRAGEGAVANACSGAGAVAAANGGADDAAAAKALLRVEGLSYSYGGAEVWRDVAFALEEGQVAFMTGPNGAGKSTLLRCLAGWDAPARGGIELCGAPLDGMDRAQRRLVAFVPDAPAFYDDLTAGEHVRFVLGANRVPAGDGRAEALMGALGLAGHEDQYPSSYSRGMRQKLALVLALVLRPRLLLLDEPYGPLDRAASAALSALVAEACADGASAIVSCHHDVPALEPDVVLQVEGGLLRKVASCPAPAERAGG